MGLHIGWTLFVPICKLVLKMSFILCAEHKVDMTSFFRDILCRKNKKLYQLGAKQNL